MRSFGLVRKALVLVFLLGCMALPLYAADTIKIGVYLPLTGRTAFGGQLELEGIQMAHKEVSATTKTNSAASSTFRSFIPFPPQISIFDFAINYTQKRGLPEALSFLYFHF